jgi:ArsR family transcriptional regulator
MGRASENDLGRDANNSIIEISSFSLDNIRLNRKIANYRYGDAMKDFIKVMKALSDPNRIKMVKLLQRKVLCVCEMQEALGLAQSTVSKHLKILEEAELITCSKDGLWVNYRLSNGASNPYAASLIGNLRHWLDEDADVAALVERLPEINRETICGG